jgi:hypothetical protein
LGQKWGQARKGAKARKGAITDIDGRVGASGLTWRPRTAEIAKHSVESVVPHFSLPANPRGETEFKLKP